jgi:type III secretion protein L
MDDRIIKAGAAVDHGASGRVLKRDIYDAGVDARGIVDAARAEAEAILRDAEARRSAIEEAAQAEGFRQGLSQWNQALQSVRESQASLETKYEPELVKMAIRIARKIIGEDLKMRPETIVSIARECLRGVRHDEALTVRVNPAHVEDVERNVARLVETLGPSRRVQVQGDSAIEPGGCVVESVVGVIDARLETQLRRLEEILLRVAVRRT